MFAAHNGCYWNHERRMDGWMVKRLAVVLVLTL